LGEKIEQNKFLVSIEKLMGIWKFFRDLTSERAYEKFYLAQPYLAEGIDLLMN